MAICYQCGKRLVDGVGREVEGVYRQLDGNKVRLHNKCAVTFDQDRANYVRLSEKVIDHDHP